MGDSKTTIPVKRPAGSSSHSSHEKTKVRRVEDKSQSRAEREDGDSENESDEDNEDADENEEGDSDSSDDTDMGKGIDDDNFVYDTSITVLRIQEMEKGKKSLTFKTKDFSVLPYSR
jgi:hypothetical protein